MPSYDDETGPALLEVLRTAYADDRDPRPPVDRELRRHVEQLRHEVAGLEAPPPVAEALDHICDALYDPSLNVDSVLALVGDPSPTFRSAFQWHVGLPPRRFIEANRLVAARRAIESTGASCRAVGYRVGYTHYRTFARAFKRFFGHSPRGEGGAGSSELPTLDDPSNRPLHMSTSVR